MQSRIISGSTNGMSLLCSVPLLLPGTMPTVLRPGCFRCACGMFVGGRSAWERHLGSRAKKFTQHLVIDSVEMHLKARCRARLLALYGIAVMPHLF